MVADPLEMIMSQLRNAGSVDPAQAQQRMAGMKPMRRQMGAAPHMQPGTMAQGPMHGEGPVPQAPPVDGLGATLQDIGAEKAEEEQLDVAPGDMTNTIIDQLNETILSLKVQVHRTRQPEQRRTFEQQAEQIREQILQLGGEPIWADETIEEGLAKLQGRGYVGASRLGDTLEEGRYTATGPTGVEYRAPHTRAHELQDRMDARYGSDAPMLQLYGAPTTQPTQQPTQPPPTQQTPTQQTGTPLEEPRAGYAIPTVPAPTTRKARVYGNPIDLPLAQTYLDPNQYEFIDTSQLAPGQLQLGPGDIVLGGDRAVHGSGEHSFYLTDAELAGATRIAGDTRQETAAELQRLMQEQPQQFQYDPPEHEPPVPGLNTDMLNQIFEQYGLRPMSEDEIAQYATDLVERQALGKRQAVQREIDRFEDEFPHEFDRAQSQIKEAAAGLTGQMQEEFASRGMYYSSVMASAVTDINEQTMDLISEIARDAANYVKDLHRDLVDIEQWAAVEREVLRRQITIEEREMGLQLAQAHTAVLQHMDQFNLDVWAEEQRLDIAHREQQLAEFMTNLEVSMHQQGLAGAAMIGNHPVMQEFLQGMGISNSEFNMMPLESQAALASSALEMMSFVTNKERAELENKILAVDALIQETYGEKMARLTFEAKGLDLAAMRLTYEEMDRTLKAKIGVNYFDRMAQLDLDTISANLGLTRAQTDMLVAQAAGQEAQTALLDRELEMGTNGFLLGTDQERIQYVQQQHAVAMEYGLERKMWPMANGAIEEAMRVAETIEDPGLMQAMREQTRNVHTSLMPLGLGDYRTSIGLGPKEVEEPGVFQRFTGMLDAGWFGFPGSRTLMSILGGQ